MTLVTIINAANFLRKHAPYPDSVPLNILLHAKPLITRQHSIGLYYNYCVIMEAKGPGPTKLAGASSSYITRPPLPPDNSISCIMNVTRIINVGSEGKISRPNTLSYKIIANLGSKLLILFS